MQWNNTVCYLNIYFVVLQVLLDNSFLLGLTTNGFFFHLKVTNMFDTHTPLYSGPPINNNDTLHWLSYVTAYGVTANTTSLPLRHNVADAPFDKTIRIAALATIVICGITGCLLVCGWLWYHRRRPSHVNALIWHLTVSDLLVVTCACLPQLVWEFDRQWTLGLVACKALKFTQSFVIMASNYMLVVLAFDRHRAIRSPLREPTPVGILNFSRPWPWSFVIENLKCMN